MKNARLITNLVAAPLLLVACFAIAMLMVKSRKTRPPTPQQEVVITVTYLPSDERTVTPTINSFGNTQSYFSTSLSSQVGGEIIEISPKFEVGNSIKSGEWLVKINPADYQANLATQQAALANAKRELAEEETRSRLAKEDWLTAGRSLEEANDLTLRKPQLEAAKASIESAAAAVDKAKLDLERTIIRTPFDAVIDRREASPGDILTRGGPIGSLIARERIQVRLPLTPSQASRLTLPRFGESSSALSAILTTPSLPQVEWRATINRVEPQIDPRNQSIYLVGEVMRPFDNPEAFLPVGAFVDASISGAPIEGIHVLPEASIVDDAFAWVVSPENLLAKQPIEIVFSQNGQILARIDEPLFALPLKVLDLPLASLRVEQKVKPVQSES